MGVRGVANSGMISIREHRFGADTMTDGQPRAAESLEQGSMTSEEQERTALFTSLGERLLQGEADGDDARRAHLLRLLASLMPAASESGRKALIERVAAMPSPPRDLALRLAADNPKLSAPLLRSAPFSQQELIELVTRTGPEHHIEIAKRADLTLDVWLALARAAARRARESGGVAAAPATEAAPDSGGGDAAQEAARPVADTEPAASVRNAEQGRPVAEAPAPEPESEEVLARPAEDSPAEREIAAPAEERPAVSDEPAAPDRPGAESPRAPERASGSVRAQRQDAFGTAPPLEDPDAQSWRFETDREGRLVRLSPNAALAFGQSAPALLGDSFSGLLQAHAAAPARDDVGEAMRRRVPLRDLVFETMPSNGRPRLWVLRGQPRFSFPDGRFEGYVGVAQDREAEQKGRPAPAEPGELLDRLGEAADRLAHAAGTPELAEYARVMKEYVEALKTSPMGGDAERRQRARRFETD